MDEKQLVEKIIKRDERVFRLFYNHYYKQIFSFIYKKIKNYHTAEEIAQDVFIDFLEGLRDFRYQSSLKTFLFSIAKNKVVDWMRKKKIKKIIFSALPSYLVEGLRVVFIEEEMEKKALAQKIRKVLQRLPNDYRFVLRQKYVDGEKVNEIAKKLQMGFKATESLLFRARKAFIKIFNRL